LNFPAILFRIKPSLSDSISEISDKIQKSLITQIKIDYADMKCLQNEEVSV
jgi:hypothetical protein